MGMTCQILINKPREGVHMAGRPVTGAVKFAVDEPVEYSDVTLSLLGKGQCSWTVYSTSHSSTTYSGSEDLISRHVNVINKRPENTVTLHGAYEHPFEFYLPEDIPTSYKSKKGNSSSIVYWIQLKFVKASFFSFNKVFTAEIPVYGFVDWKTADGAAPDGPVIFGLKKSLFAPLSAEPSVVRLKAEIAKAVLKPGENARLTYSVTNDTNVAVSSVRVDLYCCTTYTADRGETEKWDKKVKGCEAEMAGVPARRAETFACVVPTLPTLYSIQQSRVIAREYRLRLTVRLPLPHSNVLVEVPVAVGERRDHAEPCFELGTGDAPPPPTYWEAMTEHNEQPKQKEKV